MDGGISTVSQGRNTSDEAEVSDLSAVMTYDEDNRLLTYNGQPVEYDACGNMTKGPLNGETAEFTYDCRNCLVKVKEGNGAVTFYEYDAEGIRCASVSNGIRMEYITDRESAYSQTLVKDEYEKNVFGVYTKSGSSTVYTYGLGLISERRDTKECYYYHYNHLGSTMAVSMICALPFVGTMAGGSAGLALKVIGHSLTFGMAAKGTWDAAGRAVNAYESGWNFLDVGLNALGMGLSGRAALSSGRELAGRIARSETGQRIAKGFKQLAADNRGEIPWVRKSKGGSRTVNGFDTTVNAGKQGKHIVGNNNFIEGRSVFNGTVDDAQRLVDNFAGTGEWIGTNKERVNFGKVIGQYVNPATNEAVDTTVGIIHYSKTGTHIVPAKPIQ